MFVPMSRVDVIAPRERAADTLRTIHRSGLLHVVAFGEAPDVGPATFTPAPSREPAERYRRLAEEVARLGGLLAIPADAPPVDLERWWELDDDALSRAVAALRPVAARAERLTNERVRLSIELSRLEGYRKLIEGLSGAVGRLPSVRGYAATGIIVGARHRAVIRLVHDELERLTDGRCAVVAADLGAEQAAAILLYPVRMASEIGRLLGGRELEEVALPPDLAGLPLDDLGPRLAGEAERIRARLETVGGELTALAAEHGRTVASLRLVLGDRQAESAVLGRSVASDHLVVVSGWLPSARVAELRELLERAVGPPVAVVERAVAEHPGAAWGDNVEEAPVALSNGPLRAFEPLASFSAVPRYGTLDPTPLLALTFPAFVGMMVGDVGYGLVLLALLAAVRWRHRDSERVRRLLPVGLAVAFSTIVFGLVYGEWFGRAGHHVAGIEPLLLHRTAPEAILPLLTVTVVIGFAQVGLGLLLGMRVAARLHHRREVVGRAAMLTTLVCAVALAAVAFGYAPREVAVLAAAALVSAAVLTLLAMGIAGPVEMLGVVGNVLSYVRLMAIGLAGAMLAVIAERVGGLVPGLVFGVLVAALIHALNLGLGTFDASIQGLRLHYVEFFSKFVEPGGTRYAPFVSVLERGAARTATASGGP